jgi:hypothetical protein
MANENTIISEPAKEVEFFFVVAVEKDGTIQTYRELPEGLEAERPFNTLDIFKVSKEIVSDIESQLLADRVIGGVLQVLNQREQSVSDKVANALKERGVEFNAGEQTVEFSAEDKED